MSSSAQVRYTPPPPSAGKPASDATILHLAQAAEYHQASRSTPYTAQPTRPPPIVRPVVSQPNTVPNFREQAAAARRAVFEERRRAAVEARIKQQEERSAKRKKPAAATSVYNATPSNPPQDSLVRSPHLVSSPSVLSFPPHGFNSSFLLPHQSDLLQQNLARKMAAKKLSKTEDLDRQKREMKKEARVREYEIALAMRWAAETKRREEAAQRRAQVDALRRRVEQEREEKRQLAKIKKRSKLSGESNSTTGSPNNAFQTM